MDRWSKSTNEDFDDTKNWEFWMDTYMWNFEWEIRFWRQNYKKSRWMKYMTHTWQRWRQKNYEKSRWMKYMANQIERNQMQWIGRWMVSQCWHAPRVCGSWKPNWLGKISGQYTFCTYLSTFYLLYNLSSYQDIFGPFKLTNSWQ